MVYLEKSEIDGLQQGVSTRWTQKKKHKKQNGNQQDMTQKINEAATEVAKQQYKP